MCDIQSCKRSRLEQGDHFVHRFLPRRRSELPSTSNLHRRCLRGRFQTIVGPLGHDPAEFSGHLSEIPFESAVAWAKRTTPERLNQFPEPIENRLESINQLGSDLAGSFASASVVNKGCQGHGQIRRVRHGGVLSLSRGCQIPPIKKRPYLLLKSNQSEVLKTAARKNANHPLFQRHGRGRAPSLPIRSQCFRNVIPPFTKPSLWPLMVQTLRAIIHNNVLKPVPRPRRARRKL